MGSGARIGLISQRRAFVHHRVTDLSWPGRDNSELIEALIVRV